MAAKRTALSIPNLHASHRRCQRDSIVTVIHRLSPLFTVFSLTPEKLDAIKFSVSTSLWENLIPVDVINVTTLHTLENFHGFEEKW